MPPRPSMQTRPVNDMCDSACHVGCGPLVKSVNADSGNAAARHSHANRSNILTSCARRSSRFPIAKLIGQIITTANAPTLKSYPTVPQIIKSPTVAMPMLNSAWLCTITLERPTGTPCAMANACARNWPRNSVKLMEIRTGHETFGRGTNRHGNAAMAKRNVVISSGENSSSASRLATKASPQITATMTARLTSTGFTSLALLAGFRFAQQISAVQRRVIIGRDQLEANVGEHALHHPAEGRIFVAHVGDNAVV